jgi:WD40 repeat protein
LFTLVSLPTGNSRTLPGRLIVCLVSPIVNSDLWITRYKSQLCLAISPDGGTLTAGCADGLIYLLGPLSGEKRITLAGVQRGYVRSVAFAWRQDHRGHQRRSAVAALGNGQKVVNNIKLWAVTTGALVWTSAEGDLGHVQPLVFSPDGRWLYCCDSSAITRVDARTGQTRKDLMRATDGRSE